jgi:sec-independent protein translocase protein TatC
MAEHKKEMSFLDHLEELRKRVIRCLFFIIIFSIVAYFFSEQIINFVSKPIPHLYFMSPTEAFAIRIKLSLIVGLIVSVPVIFYQAWQFVVPGLLEKEVRIVIPVVVSSTVFFLTGAVFCFFLVLPVGIKFLLGFGTEKLSPLIKITDYINFISYMTLAFGAVFELPVLSYFLAKIGVISAPTLRKGRRYAIVIILIVAAALTPGPDIFSQLMLAGPLYILYEISIIVVMITRKKKSEDDNIQ